MTEGVPVNSICTQKIFELENNKEKLILSEITYSTDSVKGLWVYYKYYVMMRANQK